MSKEEYKKNLELLDFDFWALDMNGKVLRFNELVDGGYISEEKDNLSIQIKRWNFRCSSLLSEYNKLEDKEHLESPEKYMFQKFV